MTFLSKEVNNNLNGLFIATVEDYDTESSVRYRVRIPTIHGKKDNPQSLKTEELPLAMILQPPEYGTKLNLSKHIPLQLDSQVVVMFDRGEVYNPIIIGRLETFTEIVDETQSNNVEISKDPAGNTVKKTFIQDGIIDVTLASDVNVTLNKDLILVENENTSITISKDLNITVQGNVNITASGSVNIKGETISLN
ncbi:MAG: hypothetical protein LBG48_00330 [Rickettsiales bacterium]|jgi:hypothetical protein|nr:hypothetical protein [Rickettsiales bacterium]